MAQVKSGMLPSASQGRRVGEEKEEAWVKIKIMMVADHGQIKSGQAERA